MKRFLSSTGAIIILATTFVSCDKIKPPQPELQKPPVTSGEASQPNGERETFSIAAQKELDQLRSTIAELRAKVDAANVDTRAKLRQELEGLEAESLEAQQRLRELKSATKESWLQMKQAFGNSVEKLKNGVDSFRKSAA